MISVGDLCARFLKEISTQDLCRISLNKIPVQACCKSFYARSLFKEAMEDLYAWSLQKVSATGRSLYKISARDLNQNYVRCAGSLSLEISEQDLCQRTLGRIPTRDSLQVLCPRSP